MKYVLRIIWSVLLTGIMIACGNNSEKSESKAPKNELVLAIGGQTQNGFDPTTGWGRYGSPLFQSTLLKYDANLNIVKDLAVKYNASDNGLVWTVKIRDSIRFSNGNLLTAEDVVFTYRTAKNSQSIVDLTNLKKVKKIDSLTIRFFLKEQNSTFIHQLTNMGIVPKDTYGPSYAEHPVGSGPYQLVQWNKGQQLIVEANPYYYGEKPYFKKLTFLFLSQDAAFAAAKAGKVDVAYVPATFGHQKVNGMHLVSLETVDNRGVVLPFVPNVGKTTPEGYPIGNDVTAHIAVRKAMNYAVNREVLVQGVLNGYGSPAYTMVDHLPWWNSKTDIEDGNLKKGKKILEEAGWKLNGNGIRVKNGLKAAFTLYYPANDQIRQSLSIAFAQMMEPLGIKIKTEGKSWHQLERLMHANPVLFGLGSHTPLQLYQNFSTTTRGRGLFNVNYYSNPTVDTYFQKALHANTQKEAYTYWKKAQWDGQTGFSVKGDAAWVWLVNIDHLYFVQNGLSIGTQKIHPHGHGWPITDNIVEWHWKDKRLNDEL